MTTSPHTLTAANIAKISWVEEGKLAHFQGRGFGVQQGQTFLSFNGVRPSVWGTKAIATEIANTIVDDGSLCWIEVR
jgi:hypothetical protein